MNCRIRKRSVKERPPASDKFPILVVLNPNAGRKEGRQKYDELVKPYLDLFDTPSRLIETLSPGFAQSFFRDNIQQILIDLCQSLAEAGNSSKTDSATTSTSQPAASTTAIGNSSETDNATAVASQPATATTEIGTSSETDSAAASPSQPPVPATPTLRVMVMGGDGTVHEIINGILQGFPTSLISGAFVPKIEFSIVPLGTGNAIATSLGITTIPMAINRFLQGTPTPLRLIKVSKRSKEFYSHTESGQTDVLDWEDVVYTAVVNSFGLHCATVHDSEGYRALGNSRFKLAALKNILFLSRHKARVDFFGPVQRYDRSCQEMVAISNDPMEDPNSTSNPSLTLSGPFTYLMFSKQPYLEPGFKPTPLAKTSDEWMDVLAIQNVGRSQILKILGGATKNGQHIDYEDVEYFKVRVVELEASSNGRLCIDGEFLDIKAGSQGRVRFEVVQDSSLQLFYILL